MFGHGGQCPPLNNKITPRLRRARGVTTQAVSAKQSAEEDIQLAKNQRQESITQARTKLNSADTQVRAPACAANTHMPRRPACQARQGLQASGEELPPELPSGRELW